MKLSTLKNQFLQYLEIERGRSLKTVENYDRYLTAFFAFIQTDTPVNITSESVRAFRIKLNRRESGKKEHGIPATLKKNTQNYYLIALRTFLKYASKRGVKTLASDQIELAKVPDRSLDLITSKELTRLLEAPLQIKGGNELQKLRDRAILEMFFSTGLRVSELCGLSRDIDLSSQELSVRGKGEKVRVVFISDAARDAVKEYLAKRDDMDDALFVQLGKNRNAKESLRISPRSVERLMKKYAAVAGISKKVTPHIIRHSFATDLLQNGADIRSVQALLGHAHIATTQIYTHVTDKHLRDIHSKFHSKRKK